MKKNQKDLLLLPYYFRGIAFGILALSFTFVGLTLLDIVSLGKEVESLIFQELLFVGLLLLAITKEREEDELTLLIRLKSFTAAFIFGVVSVVVDPLTNLIFEGEFVSTSKLSGILGVMFLFYFIVFYTLKRKR